MTGRGIQTGTVTSYNGYLLTFDRRLSLVVNNEKKEAMETLSKNQLTGLISVYEINENGDKTLLFSQHNQIQDDYAYILSKLLAGDIGYRINSFYFEFTNVSEASETVTTTSFPTSDSVEYFSALNGDSDFVRVPLVLTPTVNANSISFIGILDQATGEHELSFGTSGVLSKIHGMALAAAPVWSDKTQDKIFSRVNWDTQVIKESSKQLCITWKILFNVD